MKEEYTKLSVQVESVESEDVITTSGGSCLFDTGGSGDPCTVCNG